ncbi:MAG: radical SAM family heme chaperone HemW [Rikenellaceae bacterium]|nr:radical SAM family heme chaperone HemW [Rikenellaceae bacterium]
MAGIYFHIPFCRRICAYCDFYKNADLRLMEQTLAAMEREVVARRDFLRGEAVRTIYFGGGTPSLASAEWIGRAIELCREMFDCSPLEEVTLEANPDDLSEGYLRALREVGVNRLSIGIQSFDDEVLRTMNRRHDAAAAVRAVETARAVGFDNITIDMIYGLPFGPKDALTRSLAQAVALGVEHLSAYHLTIEPNTRFGRMAERGELAPVPEEESERQYNQVHTTLTEAGYDHYEISNFAREGRRSRHNSSYWQSQPYLGIGPAAHSFDGESRVWARSSVADYLAGVDRGECYENELLTATDRYNETIMTSLRCREGVDLAELEKKFGRARKEYFVNETARFVASGVLVSDGNRVAMCPERWLVSDSVIAELFIDDQN